MDLMGSELEFEIKALRSEIDKLKKENTEYKSIIVDNELGDEIGLTKIVTAEEEICIIGIEQILELVKNALHTKEDIQNYDILHKHLRLIRGHTDNSRKVQKKTKVADLLKIVEGDKG